MNPLVTMVALAQTDAWKRLGDRFSGEYLRWQTSDTIGLAVLVLGLAATYGLLLLAGKWQERIGRSDRPRSPFGMLARAHGLTRRERALCRHAATELGLADPAELFVRPDTARELVAQQDRGLAERLFC